MLDPQKINDLMKSVLDAMPDGVKHLSNDVQENLKAAMRSTFSKLDLVTREEFDAQNKVLLRTREKLEALEKIVSELEHRQKDQ